MRSLSLFMVLIILIFAVELSAQAPEVEWETILGDSLTNDLGMGAYQTDDGEYIVGGRSNAWNGGYYDVVLFKLDANGDTLWSASEGGHDSQENANCFRLMPNGSYMFGGYSDQDTVDGFGYLYNADPDGSYGWTGLYGPDTLAEIVTAIAGAGDTAYVFTTQFWYSPQSGDDFKLYFVDIYGWPSWAQDYHVDNTAERSECIQVLGNSGYLIAGRGQDPDYYDYDVLLARLGYYGGVENWNLIGGTEDDVAEWAIETSDGGFLATGYTKELDGMTKDVYIVKTDSACALEWQKIYGSSYHDQGLYCLETSDGGYVVGATCSFFGSFNFWLLRLDSDGDTLWTKVVDRDGGQSLVTVDITDDGGYLLCGSSQQAGEDLDIYVVKLGPESTVDEDARPIPLDFVSLENYPNPFNGSTTIKFGSPAEDNTTLQIFDILGRNVRTFDIPAGATELIWNSDDENGRPVASGVYFYTSKGKPSTVRKMVLLR